MAVEVRVPSGAKVEIEEASLELALQIQDAIDAVLLPLDLKFSSVVKSYYSLIEAKLERGEETTNSSELYSLDGAGEILAKGFMAIKSSKRIRELVFEALKRCRYNDEKITMLTFDSGKSRGDYYPVFLKVLEVNVMPFFAFLI